MRVLAVDFGAKRIGIAVGETVPKVASSRRNIAASGALSKDAVAIKLALEHEGAEAVVIGLPNDAEGETSAARVCKALGSHLESLGVSVMYVDESLTSAEAERAMVDAGLKGSERRKRSDGEAACRILERFFDDAF